MLPRPDGVLGSIDFNSPNDWVSLLSLGIAATYGIAVFTVNDPAPTVLQALLRLFLRASPIGNTVQARLVSYYYDANNVPVFDRTWPIVASTPGYLSNVGALVQGKLNAMVTPGADNPVGRIHYLYLELKGVGTIFGARLEMQ